MLGGAGGYMYNGGSGGDAPPYSANIYGHGHGYGYYQGGQQYNDSGGGAMMAPYNGNGPPHAFQHTQNGGNPYPGTFQPSLFQRLRHSRPIVRYSVIILSGLALSYLCRRAPPPPPPHYDWTSYIVQSTHSILGEVERVSHDTVYILGGFVRNVYQDAIELKDAVVFGGDGDGTGGSGGRCVLRIPTVPVEESSTAGGSSEDATSYFEQPLRADIFGQDRAIRIISRALEAWEGPSNPASSEVQGECALGNDDGDDNSESCKAPAVSPPSQEGGRPLAILLSGPEGTGKSETTRLLARLVFPDCPGHPGMVAHEYDSSSFSVLQNHQATMPRGVLFIDGRSYSDGDGLSPEGYAQHQRTRAFSNRIVGHIQKQRGAGAVIVISQIENVSPSIAVELVRLIKSSSSADTNSNDSGGRAVVGEKGIRWNNVLFLFTSYLGADKLFQLIHTYEGTEYISDRDLTSTVRSEIDDHFGSLTGLGNAINTVATFMPLEVEQMEDILDRKVKELSHKHEGSLWKRLDVTERALSYFAGPDYMEYLSLQNRETGSTIFSFSKRGAHTLEDGALLQTLRSVRRHISARTDEIAVFDYDANEEEATIRWCTYAGSNKSSMRRLALSSYKCGNVAWKGAIT